MFDRLAVLDVTSGGPAPAGSSACWRAAALLVENGEIAARRECPLAAPSDAPRAPPVPAAGDPALAAIVDAVSRAAVCLTHHADRVLASLAPVLPDGVDLLDTALASRILLPSAPAHDLDTLQDSLGLKPPSVGALALADCERTLALWRRLCELAADLPGAARAEVARLLAVGGPRALRSLFAGAEAGPPRGRRGRGVAGKLEDVLPPAPAIPARLEPPAAAVQQDPDETAALLGRDGPFAACLPGYETRRQQIDMARDVAAALRDSKHLLVEAGTGIGKSMAYLVPAAAWAVATRRPIVVSTNTKNLQSQLFARDLPLIARAMQIPLRAAVIKGRQNYLCLRKFVYLLENAGLELGAGERLALARVVVWATRTVSGDLSEISLADDPQAGALAPMLTCSGDECLGPACGRRSRCFVARARRLARAADIVVANHSVVFAEMGAREASPVLPPHDRLVFDEAHNLEDGATSWLSVEVSQPRVRATLRRLRRRRGRRVTGLLTAVGRDTARAERGGDAFDAAARRIGEVESALDLAEPAVDSFFAAALAIPGADPPRATVRLSASDRPAAVWDPVLAARSGAAAALAVLAAAVAALADAVGRIDPDLMPHQADYGQELLATAGLIKEFVHDLDFVTEARGDEFVFWAERVAPERGGVRLWAAPIAVGARLAAELYRTKSSVVFCSATLSVGGSFDFVKRRLGIDLLDADRVVERNFGTVFDFRRQCLAMVPGFLPEPVETDAYAAALSVLLGEIFVRTRGRGLVLFTSHDMLRRCGEALGARLAHHGIQVLSQGVSGSRENLTEILRRDTGSVLLGASSFWEGVDVVGEALSCLVVARLPFAVFTDPVVAARGERVEAEGGSAFADYSLPNAVIRFRQGFGRLIRHRTDRGIVIVADRRISTRRYGVWFRRATPAVWHDFPDREQFLETIARFMEADAESGPE